MDAGFLYSPMPNARGGHTTRAALGRQITEAELAAAVGASTGLPPEQCARVFTAYLREILAAAAASRWSPGLHGLARFNPAAGGSKPDAEDFRTAEDIQAAVRLSFTAAAIREWRATLRLSSQGRRGLVTPLIASVICTSTDLPDHYVSGGVVSIRGQHLKIDQHDPRQGVFYILENGEEIRCPGYGRKSRLQLIAIVPETVTGPARLRVASWINGSVRSTIHPITLQQAPMPQIG